MAHTPKIPTVLIIEDKAFNSRKMTAALRPIGITNAVAVEDGQTGPDLMRKAAFDLVLPDIVVPGADRFEVLAEAQQDAVLREIPVLVISAVGHADEIALAPEPCAIDFLPKPVSGLLFGLMAVRFVMFSQNQADEPGLSIRILAALIVPLGYAVESILVASVPEDAQTTPLGLLFFMMIGSSVWGSAVLTGAVLNPFDAEPATVILNGAIGRMSAVSNGCYVVTI